MGLGDMEEGGGFSRELSASPGPPTKGEGAPHPADPLGGGPHTSPTVTALASSILNPDSPAGRDHGP